MRNILIILILACSSVLYSQNEIVTQSAIFNDFLNNVIGASDFSMGEFIPSLFMYSEIEFSYKNYGEDLYYFIKADEYGNLIYNTDTLVYNDPIISKVFNIKYKKQ